VRGSVGYSTAVANWTDRPTLVEYAVLTRWVPSVVRDSERIHDVTSSLEAEIPYSATRIVVLYKVSNAFAGSTGQEQAPALASRFDLRVTQALPFMKFANARWEMLVAVRNMFREDLVDASVYDELLVVRPPKRVVGGVTVKF